MNKVINSINNTFKDFFKTDLKKLSFFIFIFYLNVFINIMIIIFISIIQFDYEWSQIEKERKRLYEEGICNYEEPCEYP